MVTKERRAYKVAKTVKAKTRDGEETTWLDELSDWIGRVHKALGELKVVWHFLRSLLDLLGRLIPGHERAPKKRFAARSASPRPESPAEAADRLWRRWEGFPIWKRFPTRWEFSPT